MSYDIEAIRGQRNLVDVIAEHVELKKDGSGWKGLCPFHAEKTASFNVYTERYHCFGCGANGDVFEFTMWQYNVKFPEACKILGGEKLPPKAKPTPRDRAKLEKSIYDGIELVTPVPTDAELIKAKKKTPPIWNPKRERMTTYKPSMVFEYHSVDGQLLGYVLRVEFEDDKITPSIMWCRWGDTQGWCHYTPPDPRPLYNLHKLNGNDAPVLIVEGEKAADAAHKLLPKYVVVTWQGGTQAVKKSDWSVLKGRRVTIWPDADQPGIDAAEQIAGIIGECKIIQWDTDKSKGWDAADALTERWTEEKVMEWGKERVRAWPYEAPDKTPEAPESDDGPETPPIEAYGNEMAPEPTVAPTPPPDTPYKVLGHRNNVFFYLPYATKQVLALTGPQHTKSNLMLLAPLSYWESHFQTKKGVDWDAAYESLVKRAARAGYFDGHERIRGRGAWLDAGRVMLHLGTTVYVDGEPILPHEVESKHTYPGDIDLDINTSKVATNPEANLLPTIIGRLNWKNPLSAQLLAGWLVIAPVCGMLKWRPHIWITGTSGVGKTTVVEGIVAKTLGTMGIILAKDSTEAGIRSRLKHDALPIVIDEFEAEDKKAALRTQSVISLARVASSGGVIQKGTADGTGQSYSMRSCFCFSSINTSIHQTADENRISKLVLQRDPRPDRDERWKVLANDIYENFTQEYANKMLARALANLRTLQANCATFCDGAARVLHDRRTADQIGSMLAGLFLCYSTKEITISEAVEWIEKWNWTDHTAIDACSDEQKLLDYIATRIVRVNTSSGVKDETLGELIAICYSTADDGPVHKKDADKVLRRYGIKVEQEDEQEDDTDVFDAPLWVFIANSCNTMKELLKGSPWAGGWQRPLQDIDGAEKIDTTYFSPGINQRAIRLPIEKFLEG